MVRRSLFAVAAVALLYCIPLAEAAKVKVWHHAMPGQFEKARFDWAVLSSEGALRLSRRLMPLTGLDATHVWDVVEDRQGNLIVATGDEGNIYKVSADGKVALAYHSADNQILCLALAADGTIYAGTGPSGQIIAIPPDGSAGAVCTSGEAYVWSLAVDSEGKTIYAGTGPKGRIYRITRPGNKASLFYATKQEHILCVTIGSDNTLYAGTDKNGLVYKLDAHGKGFVLFHAPQSEVRRLLVTPAGIYAGTSSPGRQAHFGLASRTSRGSFVPGVLASTSGSSSQERASATGADKPATMPAKEDDRTSTPTAPPPTSGENSLYRIALDGTVREIFREKAMILSLLRQNEHIFIGTGMDGQLFEVDAATKERSEVARLDHGQVQCLVRRRDGSILVGAGDPAKLYVLADQYVARGTVTSDVLDAKIISKWGALTWKADMPPGTRVGVAVRSGNLAEPDETWSDWSAEQTDPENAVAAAPPARFLQYRVTLASDDPAVTPALRGLALRYQTTNQAPEVTAIDVPDPDVTHLDNPKKLKIKWSASDANDDELTFSLAVRKEGWRNWVVLEDNLDKKEYEWDTTTMPSGVYRVKIVANDRKDNAVALTGERISAPFAVAHEPPEVTVKVTGMEGDSAVVEAVAVDPLVRLTAASFAVNGQKWVNVFPTDGLFDSKKESFRFETDALKPGTYVLVLRVRDAAGNVGAGDVVFTVRPRRAP
jgi:hypothetical protein